MKKNIVLTFILGFVAFTVLAQDEFKLPKNAFGAMKARHIGPATMSGRIAALDAYDKDPNIIYVGAAGGGVWKSENGGVLFKPVFDRYTQSIGAIAIDQTNPDIVWVGTGEPWVRNSTSVGDGIYKTTNGGRSWKHLGLKETERIAKIAIDPKNHDIVYVAALGHLWDANPERGLYKTTDGGKTWEKILYVDENTGCSDVAIDPENPNIIYAGMWQFRRYPYFFESGGKGSGLYRSEDGGKTWTKITEGIPKGELGRISLSVSPANPNIVYALIEAKETGLYKSYDKGKTWKLVSTSVNVQERPFYFSNIKADPVDTSIVYKPGFNMYISEDGGHKFRTIYVKGGNIHVDLHAFYVNPHNNKLMYIGTDGGVFVSNDGGSTWRMIRNLPVSQYYHVAVDNKKPYNVYGGLQDNGSWIGPSTKSGGIKNCDWKGIGFGDGFVVLPHPTDPNIIFWEYQGGNVFKAYLKTKEYKAIKPFKEKDIEDLRFNWNTPLVFSQDGKRLYLGAQYLYKSDNGGDSWQRISGDLTTNDKQKQQQYKTGGLTLDNSSAENHCTIFTINESPVDSNIIWVGTDDGNLQVTTNGGKTWTNVVKNIPGLPANTWVSYVWPSRYDKNTVYVTFDGHRSGDKTPYVYKSTDLGKTWTRLTNGVNGYCHVIKEDFVKPNLLFLGTEFGLYVSLDGGQNWTRFTGGVPKVSVRDLVIEKQNSDVVLGTHGRGILIIDDITPLRELTKDDLNKDLVFVGKNEFIIKEGFGGMGGGMQGDDEFTGESKDNQAYVTYYMKKRHIFGDMHMELYDKDGKFIKKLPVSTRKGLNRVYFDIKMDPPKVPASPQIVGFAMSGPSYPPGEYTVKIFKNDKVYEQKVVLKLDPDSPHSEKERQLRMQTLMKAYNLLEHLAYIDHTAVTLSKELKENAAKVKGSQAKKMEKLSAQLEDIHKNLVATKVGKITGEEKLREKLSTLYGYVLFYQGAPAQSVIDGINVIQYEIDQYNKQIEKIINKDLPSINKTLEKKGLKPIEIQSEEEFLKKK